MTASSLPGIRFIAIDDNPLDLLFISEFAKAFPFLQNCGTFANALEGYEAQQYIKPDLVFLDIEMPGFTGLELLRKIRNEVDIAVFITSHHEFAIEGYELSALDYILKPLTEARFQETARRIREYALMKHRAEAYEVLFGDDTLTIKEGHNQVKLSQKDIIYLEAMQDYTKIITQQKNYVTLSTLTCFMEQLPSDRFMRIHRSYAVSLNQIKELRHSEVVCNNTVIPVGKTYRSAIAKLRL
ncbi:LytTR family DNA-binding domain-containing protein [Dyadobacter chenwenxiniae]|uniref:LytTR family DNA-binding domain-containing protein n=1 Tax=Dyadobacter chenwenxiniae TaxID=2906456 RepID=A0A9X1PL91_9BACT|nr:LytTR family DNA-binding domain-containing protein [Dyadobacter chenwenxiniae]MCF0062851.1 LytTR family DNA-binding domain-containing protein [Dyadobacter chenwenxiniae]UON84974.1 LytTR family DNA-binding domain-containing protein [Dyadobacter chenwenxiniae]